MKVLFVHGACVTDGAWWWRRMVPLLAAQGVSSAAVELPSCDGDGDLHADGDAVRAQVASADEPCVLVGHSYGGMVITDAGSSAARLVYLTAVVPDAGESLGSLAAPAPFLDPGPDGRVGVQGSALPSLFMQDCTSSDISGALARLTRQSLAAFGQAPRSVAWRTVPSTYVVCSDDRATPPSRQRSYAARLGNVVEISTGHHPFLSAPDLLSSTLLEIVRPAE
ncbi:alpha/beta hydrolase [Lentzea tibetensis]|uniref:Alpha/beta hydrolase n=1 Tax=Lentzea tibetensis TaxID=2591470 RepID=A0A563ER70_9PSEU|nr:alpha/beta hydrolase [Lentzea tibetensis]TWP50159.1 alpha/beta hydrolase [Lentzea tibetensis]